jgi:transcriptional regulator
MYIPKNMEMKGDSAIPDFIASNSFGLVISSGLEATHLPLIYKVDEGEHGVIYGHFARANEHWKNLGDKRVLVIFSGPHSYISPTWYDTQPAVPTWNYASVHCYGYITLLSDVETTTSMDELVIKYEPSLLANQKLMPEEFKQNLRQAVVGFKIVVDKIQAKEKLGQHRKKEDQQGVYLALKESPHLEAKALSMYMEKRDIGTGN